MRLISSTPLRTDDDALFLRACLPPLVATISALVLTFLFAFYMSGQGSGLGPLGGVQEGPLACLSNGRASLWEGGDADSLSSWSPGFLLSITVGFGRLSFPAAKAIDVAWDLVVGRCGQLLLIYLTYPILRASLLLSMEQGHVRMPLFQSMAFDKISLASGWTLLCDFWSGARVNQGVRATQAPMRRHKTRILAFLLITAYITACPTLLSVMTGYQAGFNVFVATGDGSMVPAKNITFISHNNTYTYNNLTFYTPASLLNTTSCEPTNIYQWGFSAQQLFTFGCFTCIFVILYTALQIEVFRNSQANRFHTHQSPYRYALDLVSELKASYGELIDALSAEEMETKVNKKPRSISLETQELPCSRKQLRRPARRDGAKKGRLVKRQRGVDKQMYASVWPSKAASDESLTLRGSVSSEAHPYGEA